MTQITSEMIKRLRESTGAGMMDCKKALDEATGDFDAATDWLRKKGLAAAAKKSGRVASEGLIGIYAEDTRAAVVEFNAETDFVAKNEQFQALVSKIAKAAFAARGDLEKTKQQPLPDSGKKVADVITESIATIGENMNLRRTAYLEVPQGYVATYIHNAQAPNLGKIGVLVALESSAGKDKLAALGKQLAMHVAAAKPEALAIEGVDPGSLEREKEIFKDQARASGKPENIIEKMIEGRIRKYYEQVVLPEQIFIMDNKSKVSQIVADAAKEAGAAIKIAGFVQFTLGEGIEKEATDFAQEVAAAAGMR